MRKRVLFDSFITILVIWFTIWIRILRHRESIDIMSIISNNMFIFSGFLSILFNTISIIVCIKIILNKKYSSKFLTRLYQNSLYLKFEKAFHAVVDAPKSFFRYCVFKFRLFEKAFIGKSAIKFNNFLIEKDTGFRWFSHVVLFIFIYIPRLIVAFSFLIDVCVYQSFYFFYKNLILLLLPTIAFSYLYMVFSMVHIAYTYYELRFINVRKVEEPEEQFFVTPKPGVDWKKFNYEEIFQSWKLSVRVVNYIYPYYVIDKMRSPYVNLITSCCYLIGWFYIIYLSLT